MGGLLPSPEHLTAAGRVGQGSAINSHDQSRISKFGHHLDHLAKIPLTRTQISICERATIYTTTDHGGISSKIDENPPPGRVAKPPAAGVTKIAGLLPYPPMGSGHLWVIAQFGRNSRSANTIDRQALRCASGYRREDQGGAPMNTQSVSMRVNGTKVGPHEVPEGLSMNDYLREYLNLTGTKFGCGIGACSACVIILDDADGTSSTIHTCITGVGFFADKSVRTIEGITRLRLGELSAVQAAFFDHFAFQCGYCTPGFVNQAQVLVESLARSPAPRAEVEARILEAMDGHICRCTGYVRYYTVLREMIVADPKLTR
jgi:aerobic-type carbon monoxide dehydrogenase small subunit (CoxS/CutS family)